MEDYEKDYQDFWKEIVENPDGSLNLDQVKRELSDYHSFMGTAAEVYMHITDGKISKIQTTAGAIISIADECEEKRHVLKPHPDYDFVDQDRVFVENGDGTSNYFMLVYDPEFSGWMLVPFTDKHFTTTLIKAGKKHAKGEPLHAYSYDLLERVEDYEFNELV